ncbi:MAG: MFS transporter [Chitinophagaceae bacterium]|nr:MFS transporter [Chitinophagaceae bacterium]
MQNHKAVSIFSIPVLVAALGYFVDIYDLLLFGIVRVKSLQDLGLTDVQMAQKGLLLQQWQMGGLLIGGIIWGMMGDKRGRLSVLFGSIILYSIANIANGFVQNVDQYLVARFIAGIGLAGELGAGITLVSELIPKEKRGLATSLVAGVGLLGAVAAYFIAQHFEWRTCYFIGGGLGVLLLLMRVSVFESGMYKTMKEVNVKKGSFMMFFTNGKRFKKYLLSILIGMPTWYVVGILIIFSKEFGKQFGIQEPIDPGRGVMFAYVAISIGDVLIGVLSQWLKSRKQALYVFYGITVLGIVLYFTQSGGSASYMYFICGLLGFGTGFWAIFVTMGAEQFGTNLRATAATTIPNMVRGALVGIGYLFTTLQTSFNYVNAGIITGIVVMVISIVAVVMIDETFGKDLNFYEE